MENVPIKELKKLPHTYCEDMRGRIFPLHALLKEEWVLWFPNEKGELTEFKPVDLVEGNYFAKSPGNPEDIIFPFLEFLEKRASWPDIYNLTQAVTSDLHNLSSSMEKIDILFRHNIVKRNSSARMIGTELEYIFLTCKSLFDLLQQIISKLWKKVDIPSKQNLPGKFSDIALHGDEINTIDKIKEKYKIPLELARIYPLHAPFFLWLRKYRIKISHEGGEFKFIFITEKGPAIFCEEEPFKDMGIWVNTNKINDNLGAVVSVVSYLITRTLRAFNDSIDFFKTRIKFPADVVPNYNMYTRGIHYKHFINLEDKILHPW